MNSGALIAVLVVVLMVLAVAAVLLAAYNAVKAGYDGSDERAYEERKSAFFDELVRAGRVPAPRSRDGTAGGS